MRALYQERASTTRLQEICPEAEWHARATTGEIENTARAVGFAAVGAENNYRSERFASVGNVGRIANKRVTCPSRVRRQLRFTEIGFPSPSTAT